MYMQPNGTIQTWNRTGNTVNYWDSTGTIGSSIYAPGGRMDFYANPRQQWMGNGFTPYQNPTRTTYRRFYNGW